MARVSSNRMVLRCYGRASGDGKWYGVCLELNLAAEANSLNALKKKLHKMIDSYIKVVIDTEDKESIPRLLKRRAPLKDYFTYYRIMFLHSIHKDRGSAQFELAQNCC